MLGTVTDLCTLADGAKDIRISDDVEKVDQESLSLEIGDDFLSRSYITSGMSALVSEGLKRLSGASGNRSVFRLKQAMGGGKTHLIRTMAFLARYPSLREKYFPALHSRYQFGEAKVCFFNGREQPNDFFWGRIAAQLGKEGFFEIGLKAPGKEHWEQLFSQIDTPVLILLDEMPTYFGYYRTQTAGQGTIADIVSRAFANLLSCIQGLSNVAIIVSELEASHVEGSSIINTALDNARKELNRVEFSITPVDLSGDETYAILKKRLFAELPTKEQISNIAQSFSKAVENAQRSKTIDNQKTPEQIELEITQTYPFHPQMKHIFALFKENKDFQQTRGLMELTSRLVKSVWDRKTNDVLLIGPQHFDFSIDEVREKVVSISNLDEALAKDIWASDGSSHAQTIDANNGNDAASQISALLLLSSLSTAVNPVKGLTKSETLECLLTPNADLSFFQDSLEQLVSTCWYLHRSDTGRIYFDKSENLKKMLKGLADDAPKPKVEELLAHRLEEMFEPKSKAAYKKVIALPSINEIIEATRSDRTLVIVPSDFNLPPEEIANLFDSLQHKNNLIILTGERTFEGSRLLDASRRVYASRVAEKQNRFIKGTTQYDEFEELSNGFEQDLTSTLKSLFDQLYFPYRQAGTNSQAVLKNRGLSVTSDTNDGATRVEETLRKNPVKLLLDPESKDFNTACTRIEALVGNRESLPWGDVRAIVQEDASMFFLPPGGIDRLKTKAINEGRWEELPNGHITTKPKPKQAGVTVVELGPIRDDGSRTLEVKATNSLSESTSIYYCEDGEVSEDSMKLADDKLVTSAMTVSFLAVDNRQEGIRLESAPAYIYKNRLEIKHRLDPQYGDQRKVELIVLPGAQEIRYSLDGTEPRDGIVYDGPFTVDGDRRPLLVFAENKNISAKASFTISSGAVRDEARPPEINQTKPVLFPIGKAQEINDRKKVFDFLEMAVTRNISFSYVQVTLSDERTTYRGQLNGAGDIGASFVKDMVSLFSENLPASASLGLSVKEMSFPTGQDLIDSAREIGFATSDNSWREI